MIVGQSGRMLAQSAFKVSIPTVVIDQFGDQDTKHYSDECKVLLEFCDETLLAAIEGCWRKYDFLGLILASGFEHRIDLIKRLADKYPLLGNDYKTVSAAKDPTYLSDHLNQLRIYHPEIRLSPPVEGKWLVKQKAACGGEHVAWWDKKKIYPDTYYFQTYQQGQTCSVVFLTDGEKAKIVGINQIWTESDTSFRFGGAVTFNDFPVYDSLKTIVEKLSNSLNLVGLCGLDFILDGCDQIYVLEINPRPVSTFDLHELKTDCLFLSHIKACHGEIDFARTEDQNYYAKTIVYASNDLGPLNITWPEHWPDWASDIPQNGEYIKQGEPFCTIYSQASSADKAIKLVHNQCNEIEIKYR